MTDKQLIKKIRNKIIEQVEFISNPLVHGATFNKEKFKEVLKAFEKVIIEENK